MQCSEQYFFLLKVTMKLMLYRVLMTKVGKIIVHKKTLNIANKFWGNADN